jgi:succinoglycan biosynthesis protein ExoM
MPEVTVAIPTFRRPRGLQRLLDALATLETAANVTVLVADNDAQKHEGFDLCGRMRAEGYRWPIRAMIVAERGIAPVRNALAADALGHPDMQVLAMLDDDEWPEPCWLDALLTEQAKTGADVLQGSILFDFEARPRWAARFDGMSDIRHASGPVEMLQGAGNLLMTRAALTRVAAPWFDPAFALSGGEDRDFFLRLKAAGLRFAWSDEAVARGVPATRTSLSWALKRAYSIGNSDMRVFLKYGPSLAARAVELVKVAGALVLSPLLVVLLAFDAQKRSDALRRLFRAAGKATALCGRHYNEYAVTHGD